MKPLGPNPNLKTTDADLMAAGTYEGMASFAGRGPPGTTCGSCLYWGRKWVWDRVSSDWVPTYSSTGYGPDRIINPRRCHKAWMMTGQRPKHGVPHYAAACSQWEAHPEPPRIRRTARGTRDDDATGVFPSGADDPA